jgi:hypothetical protein
MNELERALQRARNEMLAERFGPTKRQQLSTDRAAGCICNCDPATMDGPDRECPVHGELLRRKTPKR